LNNGFFYVFFFRKAWNEAEHISLKHCFTNMNKLILSTVILVFSVLHSSAQQKNHREIWLFTPDVENASFIN